MARKENINHRGPAQKRVLDADVILLRKVNFKKLGRNLVEMLRLTNLRAGEPEGDMPWFLDGYVAAEQPRDKEMSMALLEATKGFAIARTDTGDILAEFETKDYIRASEIALNAKAELAVNVLLNESEKPNFDEDSEDIQPQMVFANV